MPIHMLNIVVSEKSLEQNQLSKELVSLLSSVDEFMSDQYIHCPGKSIVNVVRKSKFNTFCDARILHSEEHVAIHNEVTEKNHVQRNVEFVALLKDSGYLLGVVVVVKRQDEVQERQKGKH